MEITKQRSIKHGYSKTGFYNSWANMTKRCVNSNHISYKNYGGRGIRVCKRWLKFENFLEDMGKSWRPGLQIERIKNNKGYYPDNCCWATREEQNKNKRNNLYVEHDERRQLLVEWSEETGIPYDILYNRIYILNWPPGKALTTPVRKNHERSYTLFRWRNP